MDMKGNAKSDADLELTEQRLSFQNSSSTMHYLSRGNTLSKSWAAATDMWEGLVIIRQRFPWTGLIEMILPTMEVRPLEESLGSWRVLSMWSKALSTLGSVMLIVPRSPSEMTPNQVIKRTGSQTDLSLLTRKPAKARCDLMMPEWISLDNLVDSTSKLSSR